MNASPRPAGDQLVRVFSGHLAGQPVQLCDARELHVFLGIGKRFTTWIADRIREYGFEESRDYLIASQNREANRGGHNRRDYHLTLDMAKELAMVERNDRGREARRYFIDCERRLLEQRQVPALAQSMPSTHQVMPAGARLLMVFRQDGNAYTRVLRDDERLVSLGDIDRLVDAREVLKRLTERNEMDLQVVDARKRGLLDD